MKLLGYIFAGLLVLLGLIFCIAAASSGIAMRWVMGAVLLGAGGVVLYILRMQVPQTHITVKQQIDLSGEVALEKMTCNSCGAALEKDSIELKEGAIVVTCPACGSVYQVEEAPKW